MEISSLLDLVPLWVLVPATVTLVLLSVEGGYRLGKFRVRDADEKETTVGAMVGATLGLLAFMLAFTFGMAASRFDTRRQVVLDEANAIGTTYLRAATLPEPIASETRELLRDYIDARLAGVQSTNLAQAIAKSEELHARLWSLAVAAAAKDRSAVTGLFIQSVNQVIDLHAKRVMAGLRSRVPGVIWIAIYLLAILAMGAMGYQMGLSSAKRSLVVLAFVLAFSAVLILIVDLDRPGQGLLQVSQQSMIDLQNSLSVEGTTVPRP